MKQSLLKESSIDVASLNIDIDDSPMPAVKPQDTKTDHMVLENAVKVEEQEGEEDTAMKDAKKEKLAQVFSLLQSVNSSAPMDDIDHDNSFDYIPPQAGLPAVATSRQPSMFGGKRMTREELLGSSQIPKPKRDKQNGDGFHLEYPGDMDDCDDVMDYDEGESSQVVYRNNEEDAKKELLITGKYKDTGHDVNRELDVLCGAFNSQIPPPQMPSPVKKKPKPSQRRSQKKTPTKPVPPKPLRRLMISGFDEASKQQYGAEAEKLGFEMLTSRTLDTRLTHLLIKTPARSEKFLGAVAGGVCVLTTSYFEACKKDPKCIDKEEDYEWNLAKQLDRKTTDLVKSYIWWRKRIADTGKKAYSGWRVILNVSRPETIARVLQAGGAEILSDKLTVVRSVLARVTHVLVDTSCSKNKSFVETFKSRCKKPLLRAEYLSAVLLRLGESAELKKEYKYKM